MRILTDKGGIMYLKGVSYANYSDNKWTTITEEQDNLRPQDYDSFTMAKNGSETSSSLSIITENKKRLFIPRILQREYRQILKLSVMCL